MVRSISDSPHQNSCFYPQMQTLTENLSSPISLHVHVFINFSFEGSFFFGQSSKRLSADGLRYEHRRFYTVTSIGLVSCILADQGPVAIFSQSKQVFLCNPMQGMRESFYGTSQFSPSTIPLAFFYLTQSVTNYSESSESSDFIVLLFIVLLGVTLYL